MSKFSVFRSFSGWCLFVLALFVWMSTPSYAAPARSSTLCQGCTSNSQCGAGNHCTGSSTGMGYCTQACASDGSCPDGFQCQWLAPGVRQCTPNAQGCYVQCSAQVTCPNGYQCQQGRCLRANGGQQGDFCDATTPCDAGFHCLYDSEKVGRCSKQCGPPPGAAGSLCKGGQTCDAGLQCISYGTKKLCMKTCQGTCDTGQTCSTLAQENACTCKQDSDCPNGEICNIGVLGFLGACTKAPNPPPSCGTGFSCQAIVSEGYLCLPDVGFRKHGTVCSPFSPCASGLVCRQQDPQNPSLCYVDCTTSNSCSGLGMCNFIGRVGRYCFCSSDQDCSQGNTCYMLGDVAFRHGVCRPGPQSTCQRNEDCLPEYQCQQGKCVGAPVTPSEKPVIPDESPKPSESHAETPTQDSTSPSDAGPQPEKPKESPVTPEHASDQAHIPPDLSPDKATSPDNATPEPAPSDATSTDNTSQQPACGCSSTMPPIVPLFTLLLMLLLLRRKTA